MKTRGGSLRFAARDSLQALPMVSPKSPGQGGGIGGAEGGNKTANETKKAQERTRETDCVVFLADYCSSLLGSTERLKRKVDAKSRTICTLTLESLRENIRSCIPDILKENASEEYTDIDEQHHGRLKWASPYAFNMFKIHSQRVDYAMEGFNHIYLSTAISEVGTDAFGSRLRSLVIEFLITFSQKARLQTSTLHLAVSIMDRYLSKCSQSADFKPIKITHFLQIGLACLAIAVKLEERQPSFASLVAPLIVLWMVVFDENAQFDATASPDTKTKAEAKAKAKAKSTPSKHKKGAPHKATGLLSADEMTFVRRSLASRELEVLQTLDWELCVPTMFSFLGRYSIAAELSSNQSAIALCLCDRLLLAYSLLKHPPNLLAGAIVSLVRALSGMTSWTATLQHVTELAIVHVHTCIEDIHAVLSLEQHERWGTTPSPGAATVMSPAPCAPHAIPGYVPGNSVRSKNQDYVYRALMAIPEASTGLSHVSPPGSDGGTADTASKRRKTEAAGPTGKGMGKGDKNMKVNSNPAAKAREAAKAGGAKQAMDSGVISTGGDERPSAMSASERRDALAETSAAVMSAFERMNRRGRHPSYSPSAQR